MGDFSLSAEKHLLAAIAAGAVGELGGGEAGAALASVDNAVAAGVLAGGLARPAGEGLDAAGEAEREDDGVEVELHLEES